MSGGPKDATRTYVCSSPNVMSRAHAGPISALFCAVRRALRPHKAAVCPVQAHNAEICRAGDPQGLRQRLEAGALLEQRRDYVASVLVPAGIDKSIGLISTRSGKDPTDPIWTDDPAMVEWRAFMKKYYPGGDLANALSITGYSSAFLMVHVLKQCGDNLTRDNVMRQAGCEPAELRDAVFTAWNHPQQKSHRLRADQIDATGSIRRQDLRDAWSTFGQGAAERRGAAMLNPVGGSVLPNLQFVRCLRAAVGKVGRWPTLASGRQVES